MKYNTFHIFFIFLGTVAFTNGNITLSVDTLEVTLFSDRSYTIGDIRRNGNIVCDGAISSQGTILKIDNVFSGSGHGNEEVLEVNLHVDGEYMEIQDDAVYSGSRIEVHRRTCIGEAYILNSIVTVTNDCIEETIKLQGLNSVKNCDICYGYAGSRPNRFTKFAAFDDDATVLDMAVINENNQSTIILGHATAVAQYDPVIKDGVLSWVIKGSEEGLEYFIWNRFSDNKLYARFFEVEKPCLLENYFCLHQIMIFFDSESTYWTIVPQKIMTQFCNVDIPADLNHDCKVNIEDFSILISNWMTNESKEYELQGDIDGNKIVDRVDLMILSKQWLSAPAEPSADIAPLPNGDGIVNFHDFNMLSTSWLKSNQ